MDFWSVRARFDCQSVRNWLTFVASLFPGSFEKLPDMKIILNPVAAGLVVVAGLLVAGCGKSETANVAEPSKTASTTSVVEPASSSDAGMPPLAHKDNCVACHAINTRVVGPAWRDVSEKYKGAKTYTYRGKEYPLVEGLVMKVSEGGVGNWGSMPMPPNDPSGSKKEEITQLVKFILGLAK